MISELNKILDNSLLLFCVKDAEISFKLGTRNKRIAEYLDVSFNDKAFDSFDQMRKDNFCQYYNVLTGKIEEVAPGLVDQQHYIGIPMSFLPSFLISDHFKEARNEAFEVYFENMKPLFNKIKEFKKLGIDDFGKSPTLNSSVFNLSNKLNELNIIIPEETIEGFITFIACSTTLSIAFLANYSTLDYLPSVQYVFKAQNFTLDASTYEEFTSKLNEPEFNKQLKDVYIGFLNTHKAQYIEKYENDLNELNKQQDAPQVDSIVSVYELKNQLCDLIEELKSLSIEDDLSTITSPAIIYRYWPFKNLPPAEMHLNLPVFARKEINFIKSLKAIDFPIDPLTVILNPDPFIQQLKDLREKQILDYRNKFLEEIKGDIAVATDDEEKKDLQDIADLLTNDNDLYKKEYSKLNQAYQILGYWPSLLYPAPSHILNSD